MQQLQAVCEKQEVVLTDTTSRSQELEKLLYSGDIKNLKEIEHLKAQYDASQQEVSELERDYFAEVDESDALTKEIAISETALQNKKIEHVKKQQSISAEIAEAAAKIENLQRKCQELLTVIEPQFVEKYITLKRKIHSPIAKIRNGICGGCRMGLPESLVASNDNRLTYCDHCGRILIASSD